MPLITSISGIRGTIGHLPGQNLTPPDVVRFVSAYSALIRENHWNPSVIVGRDARISGSMISGLVISTFRACGIHVTDAGLSTTPTVKLEVARSGAGGGVIITASHNPIQWNGLKFLESSGEFLSEANGLRLLESAATGNFDFAEVGAIGSLTTDEQLIRKHIDHILSHPLVKKERIHKAGLRIAVDPVNSTGAIAVPALLDALGVEDVILINATADGNFAHNPEPLAEHLTGLSEAVTDHQCDMGITVDPDVDRLAFVCEDGSMFGEEYTLVAVADYVLEHTPGATVSNLSSSRALRDITEHYGQSYHSAAVGEVNVVNRMKEVQAVVGGEGNGGVIFPELNFGRDALTGIALFLSYFAEKKLSMTEIRDAFPRYEMSKNKIELQPGMDVDVILQNIADQYAGEEINTEDGVKIYLEKEWVHLRKSNTEPIIRVYTESTDKTSAERLAIRFVNELQEIADNPKNAAQL